MEAMDGMKMEAMDVMKMEAMDVMKMETMKMGAMDGMKLEAMKMETMDGMKMEAVDVKRNGTADMSFIEVSVKSPKPPSTPTTTSILPPCRICGEKASGFHYGANTCEACKGFFRRSLKKKGNYKCLNNKDCNIGPGKRNGCPSCRYKKCLAVGMSKDAIKTGRYTHQKRTQDILEIKKLESQSKSPESSASSVNSLPTLSPLTPQSSVSPGRMPSFLPSENKELHDNIDLLPNILKNLDSPDFLSGDDNNLRMLSEIVLEDSGICSNDNSYSLSPNSSSCTTDTSCSSSDVSEDVDRMESVIETLKSVHVDHVTCLSLTDQSEIDTKQNDYCEKYKLRTDMFGTLSMLPLDQYNEFYSMTGIDIDDRQERMITIAATMEDAIRRLILFAKSIPGFAELGTSDKSNLIKASRFEFFLLGHYKGHNSGNNTLLTPAGLCVRVEEVRQFLPEDFINGCFKFSDSMKKLQPSFEEIVILKAIVLLFRDRCELIDPDRVEQIQWQLVQCLMHSIKKNRPNQPSYFVKLMDRLMEIRSLTELNYKFSRNLLVWPFIKKSHLLFEILSF